MQKWNKKSIVSLLAGALALPAFAMGQQAPEPADANGQQNVFIVRDGQVAQVQAELAAKDAAQAGGRAAYWVGRAGGKKEKAAFLGVVAVPADAALRAQLKIPRGVGLTIQSVSEDTPAAKSGLQEHDVITKIDDQWLINPQQLGVLVRMHKADDEVTLTGLREGQPITLKAKLIEKEMVINDDGNQMAQDWGVNGLNIAGLPEVKDFQALVQDGEDAPLVIRENDQTLKISLKDDQRHLVATDNNGQILFDGPVETDEQRKALPNDISEQLNKYKEQFDKVKETGGHQRIRIINNR